MTPANFIEDLVQEAPELQSAYLQHISDNDELLPHVFMGDVTRLVIEQVGANVKADVLVRILDKCESAMDGADEAVSELLSVSFAENLATEREVMAALGPLLGPKLRRQIEKHG